VASRHHERQYTAYAARRHEHAHYRFAAYRRHERGEGYTGMMMYGGDRQSRELSGGRGHYRVATLTYQPDRTTPR
jgi:hypothetical protein